MRLRPLFLLLLSVSFIAGASIETREFNNPAQERQYRELTGQLRCPQCQNTNIAESDAIVSADMRDKVYQLIQQGQTRQQIIDYMVARYGNFVSYVPPVNYLTLWLWGGPLLVVVIGGLIIVLRGARRGRNAEPLTTDERQRLARLLNKPDRKRP